LKDRKYDYFKEKAHIQRIIVAKYHREDGVPGYHMMHDYLKNEDGIEKSLLTIHHYMKELGLRSIVRRKKPGYIKGTANKTFPNLLNREFDVKVPNSIWCTDFTYMPRPDGTMRYNCTILDLCGREIIATLNSNHIDATLAINTLEIALERRKPPKGIILHSDQGSQYTSKYFNDFCEKNHVQQSMSKAGCPYDNAVMERFYNTFKHEYLNIHHFKNNDDLDQGVYDFIYIKYNHIRPHRYNNGLTPYAARCAA
jgi:transposase InsO family protein